MELEWIILAEGFGTNSNGAVTAIGINQRVVIAPTLPATTKRGVIAHFSTDEELAIGKEIEVSVSVTDPAGNPVVVITAPVQPNPIPRWPGVPAGVDIFLEIPLRLATYGEYEVTLSLTSPGGEKVTGNVPLYVAEPLLMPSNSVPSPQT